MALQKQSVPINFAQGLNTKVDPKQIPIGQFSSLQNSIFTKQGLLAKRNGYGSLPKLPTSGATYLTTFGGNLTAIGTTFEALAAGPQKWINKGNFSPIALSVIPVVRSALNQTQCDSVIAANGLVCTVYTEVSNAVASGKYVVQDSTTGQNIVAPSPIPVASGAVTGSPRVFLLGGYFVIVFTNVISSTSHLQYVAVSTSNPTVVTANADIASVYAPAGTVSWDGIVVGSNLYIAYNTASGGQQIEIAYLNSSFTVSGATSFSGNIATAMSVCADLTNSSSPIIYAAFWDSASSTGYTFAVDSGLNKRMSATEWLATGTVNNVTCTAQKGILTIAYENAAVYAYDSTIATNFISQNTVTLPATVATGTVGTAGVVLRSVGLASKAFLYSGTMYMLAEYSSTYQPTYFLISLAGTAIARFAYENGGGYLTLGLPQAQVIGSAINIAYLYKDLITSVNKAQGSSSPGIYSQTGVNLATLNFTSSAVSTAEIGNNLNLSGGFMYAYDGNTIAEQGFHLFPDYIEANWTEDSIKTPTGTWANNSTTVTLSSAVGVYVGMSITDTSNSTYIPSGTLITALTGTTATISQPTIHAASGDNLSIQGNIAAKPDSSTNTDAYWYQVIYQWTDAQGNIFNSAPSIPIPVTTTDSAARGTITVTGPNLRITGKSNVKIIIYRWSVENQEYYQVTSLTNPLLNSTTSDSWSFVDTLPDTSIQGNGLIYTNGGVVEDVGGPACTALTLFDTRLWAIDAEDQNLLWYSKQIIEGTPVEMSDLFTFYVAPNAGATASTGPMRCLAPMDDKLIIFKRDALYYINGTGPDNTGANSQYSQPIFITSTVGSVIQNSIVLIPLGLMFQSDKGIWLLGRDLSTTYLGAAVESFTTGAVVNSALAIPATNQVRFTLSSGITLMYDYFYNQWGTFVGVPAISATIYQNLHTYLNGSGSVAQETPGAYLDNGNPTLMQFTTGWINLSGLQGYQRAFFFYLLGEYYSPHKLAVGIAYDYNSEPQQLTVISPTNYSPAYGGPSPYGQGNPFGGPNSNEQWRVFLTKQRCQSFQIAIQENYDPTLGVAAGAGFSLSGLNLIVAAKKGWRPISSAESTGGQQ